MTVDNARPIAAGLVGFGFAGRTFHAPVLSAVPGLELRAVASSQPEAVQAAWPDAAVVPDVQTLLREHPEIELVVVATPNDAHFPVAKAALQAGRHVVVDKPFVLDAGQARELVELAERVGKMVSVYQTRRFDSDFLTLREVLARGAIGRPVYFESHFDRFRPDVRVRWREQPVPGAGVWVDLGAHLLDQAVQLFGMPDTLQVDMAPQRENALVEDYFHAMLRYEGGAHAPLRVVLHASMLAASPAPRYVLHGTRGSYVKHGVDPQEDALKAGGRPGGAGWGADPVDGQLATIDAAGTPHVETVPALAGDYTPYYPPVPAAIRGSAPPPVTPEEAVDLMHLLDLGRQSANECRALRTT